MKVKIYENYYEEIGEVKTTPHKSDAEELERDGFRIIAHLELDRGREQYYLVKFCSAIIDTTLTILDYMDYMITEKRVVEWTDEANELIRDGWELTQIKFIEFEEHRWKEEYLLVKRSQKTIYEEISELKALLENQAPSSP